MSQSPDPFAAFTRLFEPFKLPGMEPFSTARWFEQFKLPGLDMAAILESRRKDIEALAAANRAAYEAMQALARRQTEILTQALQGMQESVPKLRATAAGPVPDYAKQAELARNAYQKVFADMGEMAELVRQAQMEAITLVTRRASESAAELRQMLQLPAKP